MNSRKRKDDALFRKTKKLAIERDNGLCVLCGRVAADVHHIVFRSQLGTSDLDNLVCLCRSCHEEAHGVRANKVRELLKELMIRKIWNL